MVRVLKTIDDYEPQSINLENIQLTDDLQELREAIAENAHEVWAAARKKEGCHCIPPCLDGQDIRAMHRCAL